MALFLLFYLSIYGGAHAYLMTRTLRSLHLAAPYPAVFAVLSVFMVLAPILVRILERYGRELPAKLVAWFGYFWMGFFFLYLSASIALDLARGLLGLAGWLLHRQLWLEDGQLLLCSLAVAVVASFYGMVEARNIRVEKVSLPSPRIPKSAGRVRLVLISDVHLGLMVGRERLRQILDQVAALKPEIIFSTGDLVDGQKDGLQGLEGDLAALQAPLGKYAVLGNHEVFAGVAHSAEFTRRSGFRLLQGEGVAAADFLTVAGVDDPALMRGGEGASDHALLASLPQEKYTILLKHRPTVEEQAAELFDLQLSGHVHKGQIFPFNLITRLAYPARLGLSRTGDRSFLYVSRGTGTWGPPIRLLARPEVTVIDLLPA